MTITTLILLLATAGTLATVSAVDKCHRKNVSQSLTNCCELTSKQFFTFSRSTQNSSYLSGTYWLNKFCGDECTKAEAYCDTSNGGGGWLVVQKRQDGSVDFNRTWLEYEDGFGMLTGEFWYGLKALHCLTGQGGWEMRMDIKLANGTNIILQYEQFKVASAKDKYKLTVGGFQGTTTDPMAYHNGMNFTAKDNDNDLSSNNNCALAYGLDEPIGGWWYRSCWPSGIAPNILYNSSRWDGVYLNNQWHALPFIEIKIRPQNCNI